MNFKHSNLIQLSGLALTILGLTLILNSFPMPAYSFADSVTFRCTDSETSIADKGGERVSSGSRTIYIGYQQVSSSNQNPILISFIEGSLDWCRTDLETSGDDHRGYGLVWDGTAEGLYAVFSVTGTQGSSDQDFRRFASNGWLSSYTDGSPGGGGGPRASIIARVDPTTGEPNAATYVTARLSSGKTNSLVVDELVIGQDSLSATARSWYSPRNPDKSAMTCSGSSPFTYTLYLTSDLSTALYTSAEGCSGNSPAIPLSLTLSPQSGFVGENQFQVSVLPADSALPLTYTWIINGSPVREETLASTSDSLIHTWAEEMAGQTLQVTVTNAERTDLGLDPLSSSIYTFDVVEKESIFLSFVFSE